MVWLAQWLPWVIIVKMTSLLSANLNEAALFVGGMLEHFYGSPFPLN